MPEDIKTIERATGSQDRLERDILHFLSMRDGPQHKWQAVRVAEEIIADDLGASAAEDGQALKIWGDGFCTRHGLACGLPDRNFEAAYWTFRRGDGF